jgi:hypothetical protein
MDAANSSTVSANQVNMRASSPGEAGGNQQQQQQNNNKAQVPTFNGIPLPDNSIRASSSRAQEIDGLGDLPSMQKQETRGPGGREMFSIHGEQVMSCWSAQDIHALVLSASCYPVTPSNCAPLQAARRRAIGELIFFAGTNDLRRCKQIAGVWSIKVRWEHHQMFDYLLFGSPTAFQQPRQCIG